MGGIIAGFLNGAGQGAAIAGQMMLADKLAKEREEANFLRDSALKVKLQTSSQEYNSSQGKLAREHAATLAETRESGANTRNQATITSREGEGEKNRANAIELANLKPPKNPQTVTYTDPKTGLEQPAEVVTMPNGERRLVDLTTGKPVNIEDPKVVEKNKDKGFWSWLFGDDDTPAPDVSRETSVAPDTQQSKPFKNGDEAYAAIMKNEGADKAKAAAAVQKKFPDWKAPTGVTVDINPIKDAGAGDDQAADASPAKGQGVVKSKMPEKTLREKAEERAVKVKARAEAKRAVEAALVEAAKAGGFKEKKALADWRKEND